jgi:hypothetical protein
MKHSLFFKKKLLSIKSIQTSKSHVYLAKLLSVMTIVSLIVPSFAVNGMQEQTKQIPIDSNLLTNEINTSLNKETVTEQAKVLGIHDRVEEISEQPNDQTISPVPTEQPPVASVSLSENSTQSLTNIEETNHPQESSIPIANETATNNNEQTLGTVNGVMDAVNGGIGAISGVINVIDSSINLIDTIKSVKNKDKTKGNESQITSTGTNEPFVNGKAPIQEIRPADMPNKNQSPEQATSDKPFVNGKAPIQEIFPADMPNKNQSPEQATSDKPFVNGKAPIQEILPADMPNKNQSLEKSTTQSKEEKAPVNQPKHDTPVQQDEKKGKPSQQNEIESQKDSKKDESINKYKGEGNSNNGHGQIKPTNTNNNTQKSTHKNPPNKQKPSKKFKR